jgi:branched-chain amino acid aminotransferase
MPVLPEEIFMDGLEQLVRLEEHWLPAKKDLSLYIRPFVIATEPKLGVRVSEEYLFAITCSPAGKYYAKPLKVKIETQYVRAAEGGTGYAKCGGNYGGSFYPAKKAREEGFDQVIWTDARHNEFIEESGMMNIMFFIDNKLITPVLGSSILDGITRDAVLQLAKDNGITTEERRISYHELQQHFEEGKRIEAFGAGTAAVICTISSISIHGKEYDTYTGPDALVYRLKKQLEDIRLGNSEDIHGWNFIV